MQITATRVYYDDDGANSHKMYTTYVGDNFVAYQWGRQGTAGQWNGEHCSSRAIARSLAAAKIDRERGKGYGRLDEITFDCDAWLDPDVKNSLKVLHDLRDAALTNQSRTRPAPPVPAPVPAPPPAAATPVAQDRHAEFTARCLEAITLAVTDAPAAMARLAVLREEFKELEQIHGKAASYLSSLDSMLLGPVNA